MKKSKEIVKVTPSEMVELLNTVEKGTFVNVLMDTDVRMNKIGNPLFGKVKKLSSSNYLIGFDYEQRVRNNMKKQGFENPETFESYQPKGKVHVSKCVLRSETNPEITYLMMERFKEIKTKTVFHNNGKPLNETDLEIMKSFQVKVYESTHQPQVKKVEVLTPKLENIKGITLNGKRYEMV